MLTNTLKDFEKFGGDIFIILEPSNKGCDLLRSRRLGSVTPGSDQG